jgi:uncharacterized protein YydD (DUF2326 family)
MKISKIYSNNKLMNPIIFNTGFNIIYGDIDDEIMDSNEHNLGKTSLVSLIDFLLLKRIDKNHFLSKHKTDFRGWIFYIELEIEKNYYLTIKRPVDKSTSISFKVHYDKNQDFSESDDWDKKDVKLYSKKEEDAVTALDNYLNFSIFQRYSVRNFLPYLLRTQYGYEDIFKMKQFEGLDIDWKPLLFNLLGYKNEDVEKKYELQYEIKNYKNLLKVIVGNKKKGSRDSYILKAAISEKEKERELIMEQINQFDFYLKEKKLNKNLVEGIESKIAKLNSERYRLDFEIKHIKESLGDNITFNIVEIKELFEQASIFFPEQLQKDYDELLKFNKSLSEERSKYLKEDLSLNLECINKINTELKKLNHQKEDVLSFLRGTDTFNKYKSLQNEVVKIDEQIGQFKLKLESLGTAENYEKKIDSLKEEAKDIAQKIKLTIDEGSEIFDIINNVFKDIFKKVMSYTAILVVGLNKEGNPDFESIIIDNKNEDQLIGQGDGYSATKIQCAAFVLAILVAYKNKKFVKFAYHDGVIEGCGNNPKINFLREVRSICKEHDIQYIISVIRSDIPSDFKFEEGEVVTKLTKEKPLYGFEF